MSKGDEYAEVVPKILLYMYEAGAIGKSQAVQVDPIAKKFGLQPPEVACLMELLVDQGNVKQVELQRYALTAAGFEAAGRLSEGKSYRWVRPSAR
jgi:DNA-binding IclR family transcriptional regulator